MTKKGFLIFLIPALLATFASQGLAGVANSYDEPDTTLASNTVIDFVEHNNGLWLATGEGVSFTLDSGRTWLVYRQANGLTSNSLSAMYSAAGRLWVATSHGVIVSEQPISISDGVSYTDDGGDNWTQVDFDSLGFSGTQGMWGVSRTIFDIAGHYDPLDPYSNDNFIFLSSFAAGFVASRDGGQNWRRIFPSVTDSINFTVDTLSELNFVNRNFSCRVDTTHGDSLFVWTGTAGGLIQYIYAIPREKAYANKIISDIIFNPQSDADSNNYLFFAGDRGVTRGFKRGGPYLSRFALGDPNGPTDGLPGPFVTSLHFFGGRLFAGTADSAGEVATGLAASDDFGDSYQTVNSFTPAGLNNRVNDFAEVGSRLYLAAEEAGLFVSADTGLSWSHIWVDNTDTTGTNRRNVVNALATIGDTLRVGTDSGLVTLYLDPSGGVDSSWNHVFTEDAFSSTKVVGVRVEEFLNPADSTFDSLAVWTINYPLTASGEYCVRRSSATDVRHFIDTSFQVGVKTNDITFFTDTVFAAGEAGVRFSVVNGRTNMDLTHPIREGTFETMDDDEITVFKTAGDTVFVGSDNGFAVSFDRGTSYNITRINRDTLSADAVIKFTDGNTGGGGIGITGNFIPAVGVQTVDGDYARIWTSNKPGPFGGSDGISVGVMNFGNFEFVSVLSGRFAWNFEFNGDTVFAATDSGLIINHAALGTDWDDIPLVDEFDSLLTEPGTPVFAAKVYGDDLWIGTGDGTFKMDLSNLEVTDRFIYVDSTSPADKVYAFPVPYSMATEGGIDFHFTMKENAEVTLEIYDYAMNLVATVMDNISLPAGLYHGGQDIGIKRPKWYGVNDANGNGSFPFGQEKVAVGIYHFKFEYSTGEVHWGKLAVIP